MKLERVLSFLKEQSRVKLFVRTPRFCMCAHASHPRSAEEGIFLEIGSSVRVVLDSGELVQEPDSSGTLLLLESHKLTRRLHTHRRHLREDAIPEEYFRLASEL